MPVDELNKLKLPPALLQFQDLACGPGGFNVLKPSTKLFFFGGTPHYCGNSTVKHGGSNGSMVDQMETLPLDASLPGLDDKMDVKTNAFTKGTCETTAELGAGTPTVEKPVSSSTAETAPQHLHEGGAARVPNGSPPPAKEDAPAEALPAKLAKVDTSGRDLAGKAVEPTVPDLLEMQARHVREKTLARIIYYILYVCVCVLFRGTLYSSNIQDFPFKNDTMSLPIHTR